MVERVKAFILNDTRPECHHGCATVYQTIAKLASASRIDIIGSSPVHVDWRESPSAMSCFDAADLIIVNGEGTIHHNQPAGNWLLAAGPMARAKGKRAALINMTWQENGAEYIEMTKSFDIVAVRESASEAELARCGINARRIPDLALYHQPTSVPNRRGIAYSDCIVGPEALDLYRRMWMFEARPLTLFYNMGFPRSYLGLTRRFVPGLDILNPQRLALAMRAAAIDCRSQTPSLTEFGRRVASSALVVTGRFHMLIFALSTRTPFLIIESNTHKNSATLNDSGLESWRHVAVDEIDKTMIDKASRWHDDEEDRLDTFVSDARVSMEDLFSDMREICEQSIGPR